MKKILFLLFIFSNLSAGVIDDLEQVIMESDLPAVEQLLRSGAPISATEKLDLMDLATIIIQKREVLRNSCELNGWVLCPEINKSLVGLLNEWKAYRKKSIMFFLLSAITFCSIPICCSVAEKNSSNDRVAAAVCGISFFVTVASFGLCVYNLYKSRGKVIEWMSSCVVRCEELYNASVKIRQRLNKIVPAG